MYKIKKFTKPHTSKDDHYIFTEEINYHETGEKSIWGTEDSETLKYIRSKPISGKWMNLCAGDGRFNTELLKRVSQVVACDIDKSALSKLQNITPKKYRNKLQLKSFNITKKFPFADEEFDGVFFTGTLHLFPEKVLKKIAREINRILKHKGKIIIDYATDIKRVLSNGKLYTVKDEPNLTLKQGIDLLKNVFGSYDIIIKTSVVPPEKVITPKYTYTFSSNFILLYGVKKITPHNKSK